MSRRQELDDNVLIRILFIPKRWSANCAGVAGLILVPPSGCKSYVTPKKIENVQVTVGEREGESAWDGLRESWATFHCHSNVLWIVIMPHPI